MKNSETDFDNDTDFVKFTSKKKAYKRAEKEPFIPKLMPIPNNDEYHLRNIMKPSSLKSEIPLSNIRINKKSSKYLFVFKFGRNSIIYFEEDKF